MLQPLEDKITQSFLPALTGLPPPNGLVRELMALPARLALHLQTQQLWQMMNFIARHNWLTLVFLCWLKVNDPLETVTTNNEQ